MTPKEYLSQVREVEEDIRTYENEYEDLKSSLLSASKFQDDLVSGQRRNTSEDKMMKLFDRWDRVNESIDLKVDLKDKITSEIQNVQNANHRRLLYNRYICLMSWEQVAVSMNYGIRHVYKLHGSALNEFEECNPDLFLKDGSQWHTSK